jgi:hypothetical protein
MQRTNAFTLLALSCLALAPAASLRAQAWLPPKGEASLSLGYSYTFAGEHIDYQGNPVAPGKMTWNNIVSDLGYGVSDRFAVRLTLPPFVVSKYGGTYAHPPQPGHTNIDDGAWRGTFQDFRGELRFRATRGSIIVTPFAALIVPSHGYEYYGHPAAGRDLVEGQLGFAAARLLDPWLPNAYVQVRYLFGIPEKVQGMSHNRSQLSFDLGYLIGSAFSARFLGTWQKSYGGWRAPIDWPDPTSIEYVAHDQVEREDYLQLGGAVSYALSSALDLNVFGYGTASARSYVNMKGVGASLTFSASPAQLIRRKRRQDAPGQP